MTSPNIGSAEVDVDAYVDESELADAGRRAGRATGDSAAKEFLARFRRGLRRARGLFARLSQVNSGDLAAAEIGARVLGQRFGFAFRRGLRRARGLFDRLSRINSGDLAAAEIGARALGQRFAETLRGYLDSVRLVGRVGFLRDLDDAAFAFGSRFRVRLQGALGTGRGLLSGIFGSGGLLAGVQGAGVQGGRLYAQSFTGAVGRVLGRSRVLTNFAAASQLRQVLTPQDMGLNPSFSRNLRNIANGLIRVNTAFNLLAFRGVRALGSGLASLLSPFRRYIALAGLAAVVTVPLIPLVGRLYNGLVDIAQGALVGLPAGIAALAGSIAVFKLGAEGLKEATSALGDAFEGIQEQLSATFLAGGLQEASRLFARRQVPAIRRGLDQLTAGYRDFIAAGLNAGAVTAFGSALERVGINSRGFLDNFAGALVPISTILNRLLTQVSDTFPELGRRLSTFFTELEVKSRNVDFGEIFLTGIQGAINLGKAIGEAGLALSEFFDAAVGGDGNSSAPGDGPFAGLLANVRELRDWIRENRADIEGFFDGLGTVVGKLGTAARGVGGFLVDVFEPLQRYFTSSEFKEGFREIEQTLTKLSKPASGEDSVGTQIGDALAAIAKAVVDSGPEMIDFFAALASILATLTPVLEAAAPVLKVVAFALGNLSGIALLAEGIGRLKTALKSDRDGDGRTVLDDLREDIEFFLQFDPARLGEAISNWFAGIDFTTIGVNLTLGLSGLVARLRGQAPSFAAIGPLAAQFFAGGFTFRGLLGITFSAAIRALVTRLRELLPSFPPIGVSAVQGFISGFAFRGSIGDGLVAAARALLARLTDLAGKIATARAAIAVGREVLTNPIANARRGLSAAARGVGSLTRRADGGLITRPEVALIGEAGPELVLPLTRPKRAQQLLAEAGLVQTQSVSRVEVRAPITVYGHQGLDALAVARETERRLMRMVR